jgi:hypothetical protein
MTLGGGLVFGTLSGCNPEVRDTLVVGLQDTTVGLVSTLLDALFAGFLSEGSGGGVTTVQVVFEELTRWLA